MLMAEAVSAQQAFQVMSRDVTNPIFIGHTEEYLCQFISTATMQCHYLWYVGWNAKDRQATQ
jgi:hypothetical protein